MITVVFTPFPMPTNELVDYFAEASAIQDKLLEKIRLNSKEIEGYIRFNLCVPHMMYEVDEISVDFKVLWTKFVKQGISKELYDWLV